MILLIVTGGEIAFVVISYVRPDWVESSLSSGWNTASNDTRALLQENLACCGFANMTDRPQHPCPSNATGGCYVQMQAKVAQYDTYVQAAGYSLIAVELIIMALTLTMACTLKTEEEKKEELEKARQMSRDANGAGDY